jgi:hypothetical protein
MKPELWPSTFGRMDGRTLIVERRMDCEPIIENNKALKSLPQKSDWGRHVASVPNIILEKWLNEEWERGNRITSIYSKEMDAVVALKLQDPEWQFLRVDR